MIHVPKFDIAPSEWVEQNLLKGKLLSKAIQADLTNKVEGLSTKPGLAVLLIGEDPASQIYVGHKEKAATACGFKSIVDRKPDTITQEEVLKIINNYNQDESIHGILVQLPLPRHLNADEILQAISPGKDADGFHAINAGRLFTKQEGTVACTPLGIMVMLNQLDKPLAGLNALVLGRSNIVGKPMAQLLLDFANCTVTLCHSKTKDLQAKVREADILVAAMGVRDVVDSSSIKPNSIVIDVGMHRVDGKLVGDLNYKEFKDQVEYVTPVPGGVGPMTIAMLLNNTLLNYQRISKK